MLTTIRSISTRRLGLLLSVAAAVACQNDLNNPVDGPAPIPVQGRQNQMAIWPAVRAPGDDLAWTGSTLVTTPAVRVVWLAQSGGTESRLDLGVSNVTVHCAITAGGGSIRDSVVVTDSYGLASCGDWTLGPIDGLNAVTVSADGAAPVIFTTFGRPHPDIVASYTLVGQEGNTDPAVAGGQIVLGSDGSLELGQDYYWDTNPTGFPMPPSRWRLGAYAIDGTRLELPDSPESIGEIRGDSLIVTTTLGDADGGMVTTRTVYVRSDLATLAGAPRKTARLARRGAR